MLVRIMKGSLIMKTVVIKGSGIVFGYEMIKLFRHSDFNTVFHSICYNKNSFAQRDDVDLEKYGRLFIVSLISDTHH